MTAPVDNPLEWLNPTEYPFEAHHAEVSGGRRVEAELRIDDDKRSSGAHVMSSNEKRQSSHAATWARG